MEETDPKEQQTFADNFFDSIEQAEYLKIINNASLFNKFVILEEFSLHTMLVHISHIIYI